MEGFTIYYFLIKVTNSAEVYFGAAPERASADFQVQFCPGTPRRARLPQNFFAPIPWPPLGNAHAGGPRRRTGLLAFGKRAHQSLNRWAYTYLNFGRNKQDTLNQYK